MISSVMPVYPRAPLRFAYGKGSWLMDHDGGRYLDMGSGIAVNSLGHAHPDLIEVLEKQAKNLWHTSNLYHVENQKHFADMLVSLTFADTVFFTNSGAESMECAVKMARKYHHANGAAERVNIITLKGGFHGRTLGMISAVANEKLIKGFGPLLPGFIQVPSDDIDAVRFAVDDKTAAVIIEPVMGDGGIIPLSDHYLRDLRALCNQQGILLILDEVQCGVGRTGKLFAHEWAGITPDIMAVAKGIGGGFPLGACLATKEAAKGMTAGSHGSTYGGNPLATAVGMAVLERVNSPMILENVNQRSAQLCQGLEKLMAEFPEVFKSFRGLGLMLGIECVAPNMDVVNIGYDFKILTVPCSGNVVRLLPPLNISEDEINQALKRISKVATEIKKNL